MVKTTLYMPEDLKQGLHRVALRSQRSEADLIREAVAKLIADQPPLPDGHWGAGSSGDRTPMTAERFDKLLAAGFGAEGLTDDRM